MPTGPVTLIFSSGHGCPESVGTMTLSCLKHSLSRSSSLSSGPYVPFHSCFTFELGFFSFKLYYRGAGRGCGVWRTTSQSQLSPSTLFTCVASGGQTCVTSPLPIVPLLSPSVPPPTHTPALNSKSSGFSLFHTEVTHMHPHIHFPPENLVFFPHWSCA